MGWMIRSVPAFSALAALLCANPGCGDNIKPATDGGMRDDAAIPDGGGQLDFPDSPGEYQAGLVAYIDAITIPELENDEPTCCRDFGPLSEDDGIDNAFAGFFETVATNSGNLVDLEAVYAEILDDGDLIWLIDHRGLDIRRSDTFTLAFLYGVFEGDTTVPDARSGTGTFTIDQGRSFEDGTGTPRSAFPGSNYNRGIPSIFTKRGEMVIPFAAPGGTFDVPLRSAEVRGEATAEADGVSYASGTISGYIAEDDFYTSLNETLEARCQCIAGDLPIFTQDGSGDWNPPDCPNGNQVATACDQPGEEICVGIASSPANGGACTFWTAFSLQLDLDTDGDEEADAASVGIELTATRGEIVEVEE